ncbi:hypothetical protein JTB14_000781 [Gonioctena quinquepunctata]|nr:hypothetical protein JTB14_000781 [Gonioctena quinquepunctata]
MESSHSEPPEPEPPDKVSTPSTSPPRKSRSLERTVKRQSKSNQSEQTQSARLVSTAKDTRKPPELIKRISCSSTDKRKRDSVQGLRLPKKQNKDSRKSVKTVNTLAGVQGKDTDSDSVSLADKCASSEDLSLGDVTITDVTDADVTDVTSDSAMIIEGNVISSPESPLNKKPKIEEDSPEKSGETPNPDVEPQVHDSSTTLPPPQRRIAWAHRIVYGNKDVCIKDTSRDLDGEDTSRQLDVNEREASREPDIEGISSNKDNPTPSSEVPSIVKDIKAEATELELTKAPELIVTVEPVNTPNEAHEAPSTKLDVLKADSSKEWASEVDEASDEAFGKHESPSFAPKAGNTEEVQVDISKTHDIDYESLESKQTIDGSEKSEADPAGNSRGAKIGRRPRADSPQEEESAVGDTQSDRMPRVRLCSESRKPSDNSFRGNGASDSEFTVENMQKAREIVKPTITPHINEPIITPHTNEPNILDPYWLENISNIAQDNLVFFDIPENNQKIISASPQMPGMETKYKYGERNFSEKSAPEHGKVVLQGNILLNPKAPEGPSSEIAETPSEPSEAENKIFGKCGENPITFQKPLEATKELITQGNVLPTPPAGNQMMLAVRQQKERAQVKAELDRQTAYVSEYQTEANNDQITEAMDYQTTPCVVAKVAQVCQEQKTEKYREKNQIEKEEQTKPSPKPIVRRLPGDDIPLPGPFKELTNLYKEAQRSAFERNQALIEQRAIEAKLKNKRKLPRRKSMEDKEPNIEREIRNIKTTNKKGTVILQAGPTTPEMQEGGKMIERKAKSTMGTLYKNRETKNDTSDTDSNYQYYEEKLDELMNKVREETNQHVETHLNYFTTYNTEVEEINHNMIRNMCREQLYEMYEKHYRKNHETEIQRLTERLERHTKHPEFSRKKKKVELNEPEHKPMELDPREKHFPPLGQRVKIFKEPKASTSKGKQTHSNIVETSNMFGILSTPDSEAEKDLAEELVQARDVSEEHSQKIVRTITNKNKKKKPTPQLVGNTDKKIPPIVVDGRAPMTKRMAEILKEQLKGQYRLEYKSRSTLAYTANAEDHALMRRFLLETGSQFHPYTLKGEKTHAFVIKGLESEPTPEELEEALKDEHQLKVLKVHKMRAVRNLYLGNSRAEFIDAPPPSKQAWNNHNQNHSLRNIQQPRNEERRIQPTQGASSIPKNPPQVVSGVTGGISENSGFSIEDVTNRIKTLNSLVDLPRMIRRLDSLINEIINARDEGGQMRAFIKYTLEGGDNP